MAAHSSRHARSVSWISPALLSRRRLAVELGLGVAAEVALELGGDEIARAGLGSGLGLELIVALGLGVYFGLRR